MILFHDYAALFKSQRAGRNPMAAIAVAALAPAVPFRLSPLATEAVFGLVKNEKALEASRPHLFLPAPVTWLEWERPTHRVGWLLTGHNGSIHAGEAVLAISMPGHPIYPFFFEFNLPDTTRRAVVPVPGGDLAAVRIHNLLRLNERPIKGVGDNFWVYIQSLLAALALINTPRIADLQAGPDLSRLNKTRVSRGKEPLVTWRDVHINLDQELTRTRTGSRGVGITALHFVRAFMRVRLGKVELVRPHHRGNPRNGIVNKRYHVVRADDVNSQPEG